VGAQPGAVPCPVPLTPFCIDFALSHDHQRLYLWRVVDQDRNVLDILLQSRQDKKAAMKFYRDILKDWPIFHKW
jgi:DDE superfamily endonuclease